MLLFSLALCLRWGFYFTLDNLFTLITMFTGKVVFAQLVGLIYITHDHIEGHVCSICSSTLSCFYVCLSTINIYIKIWLLLGLVLYSKSKLLVKIKQALIKSIQRSFIVYCVTVDQIPLFMLCDIRGSKTMF